MSELKDFDEVGLDELVTTINKMCYDNADTWRFGNSRSVIYKYKSQFIRITVAITEEDLD